jgi:hypothetical protein
MNGKTASQLLADVDAVLDKWINHHIPMPSNFHDTLGYQIGFYGFEEELETFLKTIGIDMVAPGMFVNWRLFESFYCDNLITDCVLKYRGKSPLRLIHTGRVERFKTDEWPEHKAESADSLPFGIRSTFEGDGDQLYVFTIDVPKPEIAPTLKSTSSQLIVHRTHPLHPSPKAPTRPPD